MFLHIGDSISIYKNDIIAILDKVSLKKSKKGDNLFTNKNMEIVSIDEKVKTYILTEKKGKYVLYESNISSSTLLNR